MSDDLALPVAEALLGCLCDALAQTVRGPVCRCSLVPGEAPTVDVCCDCDGPGQGQGSVRLVQLYPTTAFPDPSVDLTMPAALLSWAGVFELAVFRCVATVDDDGTAPSADELAADAAAVADDAAAMRTAVRCCFPGTAAAGGCGSVVLPGPWSPSGPSGGCAGGQMTVTVDLGAHCCPSG